VTAARAALGEEAWAAAVAAGRLLTPTEAFAEALTVGPRSVVLPAKFDAIAARRK
jgi:hypothetical protein